MVIAFAGFFIGICIFGGCACIAAAFLKIHEEYKRAVDATVAALKEQTEQLRKI